MFQTAVTVSLVSQARGGPFVFWDDLPLAAAKAAELGFQGIEIFAPNGETLKQLELPKLLEKHGLKLAAVGTGAGWLIHRLTLCDPERSRRQTACDFVRHIIDAGGPLGAPAIVGSMQGRHGDGLAPEAACENLRESLNALAAHARGYGVPLLYEPLNRYETNLATTQLAGVDLISQGGRLSPTECNLRILADLFHMNIEEVDLAATLRALGPWLGHLHFVDSNRRAAGAGHLHYLPIFEALRHLKYGGWLSAEALSLPDAVTAARQTIETFRRYNL